MTEISETFDCPITGKRCHRSNLTRAYNGHEGFFPGKNTFYPGICGILIVRPIPNYSGNNNFEKPCPTATDKLSTLVPIDPNKAIVKTWKSPQANTVELHIDNKLIAKVVQGVVTDLRKNHGKKAQ